jgi:hypothetical protein
MGRIDFTKSFGSNSTALLLGMGELSTDFPETSSEVTENTSGVRTLESKGRSPLFSYGALPGSGPGNTPACRLDTRVDASSGARETFLPGTVRRSSISAASFQGDNAGTHRSCD